MLVASREEDGSTILTVALKPIARRSERISLTSGKKQRRRASLTEHDFHLLETPSKIQHGPGDHMPTGRLYERISAELPRRKAEMNERLV